MIASDREMQQTYNEWTCIPIRTSSLKTYKKKKKKKKKEEDSKFLIRSIESRDKNDLRS